MKHFLISLVALLAASTLPYGNPARAQAQSNLAENAVLTTRSAWLQAYGSSDEAALAQLLRDDFTVVVSNGELLDKGTLVERAKKPPLPLTMAPSDVSVRREGPVAVVTSKVLERRGPNRLEFRVTDVLVRNGARWQLASSHWTRTAGDLTEVKLPSPALDRLAGTYWTPRRVALIVTRVGDKLQVREPSGQSTELTSVSATQFVAPGGQVRWLFIPETSGESRHAVIANQGVLTLLVREATAAGKR